MEFQRTKRIAARAGLSLAVTLLACLGAEFGFRLWKHHGLGMRAMWVRDADLVYSLNPDASDSPGGFRGGLPEPPASEPLVVCLGGSTTYGYEVSAEDAWPALLEGELRDAGCPATVVNGGVSGHGASQLLLRYERDVRPLRPRVLVIYSLWNYTGVLIDPDQFAPAIVAQQGDSPLRRLFAFGGAHSLLVRRAVTLSGMLDREYVWTPDPHHAEYARDIRALVDKALDDGADVILVGPPALYHDTMSDEELAACPDSFVRSGGTCAEHLAEYERKMATLRSIAEESGARFINLQSALATRGEDRRGIFMDEMHLTIGGNRFAARGLAPAVGRIIHCAVPAPPLLTPGQRRKSISTEY